MLKIGDFAKLARVSVKTLRHYDKLGLLKPAWVDRFTGYRYYALDQLPRLNRILALKDLRFSLEEVRRLLQDDVPAAEMRGMLRLKRAELERLVRTERSRLERVEARLRRIEQEGQMPDHEVVLKSVPPRTVVGIRRVIPGYHEVGRLFAELDEYLEHHGLATGALAPRIAVYYEVQGNEQGIDAEVAVPVAAARAKPPAVVHELPGVRSMACLVHQGGYDSLGDAYSAAMAWIEGNGFRVAGPTREVYLHEPDLWPGSAEPRLRATVRPAATGDASQQIIDVQFPVQKKPVSTYVLLGKEKGEMQPKIVHKPEFTAVGMEYRGKNENQEIKQMWQEFVPRIKEIKHANFTWGTYGICRDMPAEEGLKYLAGVEVDKVEDVPAGMAVWTVPEQTYAVFACTLPTLHEAYRHAFETWLPQSEYQRGDGPDFELYTDEFDDKVEDSKMYIYVPVK
jgi:predicted transcriptional regulator YdeE/DNA-binding transcriptional MerR regulator